MNEAGQREEHLFEAALKLPADARAGFLAKACGTDHTSRGRVELLLDAHERAGGFMKEPASLQASAGAAEVHGWIGRYHLLRPLGEGGCGVVYLAEQQEPIRRQVALKVIKLGMDTREVIARFDAERQALAMMDHPNIARVFDAGATETGRPYFVMELVHGIRITDYCDFIELPPEGRLKLFIQVCQAVQHAHQKGVIHRDLKPSNILVTIVDGGAVPKVIDFGIAKATQGRLGDFSIYTRFQQMIGTPLYMSPEQAEMNGIDVDTRTDIYALGVLLYELLTGRTPFDAEVFLKAGYDEMRRLIREQEPQKPSTALDTMAQAMVTEVAHHRASEPPKLIHAIRGDLDWIVMKALEKDRARRYETANGLAMDIQRHLDNEPVIARPPSAGYKFRKLVRRNKLAFAAGTAIAASLVIGLATATWMYFRESDARKRATDAEMLATERLAEVSAERDAKEVARSDAEAERKRAQTEALKSRQVAEFLKQIFEGANPYRSNARDRTLLKEILDRASTRLNEDMVGQPEVQAELQTIMGHVYDMAGEYGASERMCREALETWRSLGNNDVQLATSIEKLSDVLWRQGRQLAEAEILRRECLAIWRRIYPGDHNRTAWALRNLGQSLCTQGKLEEAEAVTRESLDMQRRLNRDDRQADVLRCLAGIVGASNRLAEAESLARQSVTMFRKESAESISMSFALKALAQILDKQGKTGEAITLQRESAVMMEQFTGGRHPWTRVSRDCLLKYLEHQCEYEEAEALLRKQLAEDRALVINESSVLGRTLYRLADVLRKRMKFTEARALAEEAVGLYKSHPAWAEGERRDASKALSEVIADTGELATLEELCRKNLHKARASRPVDRRQLATALAGLIRTLLIAEKFAEAEPLARECLIIRKMQTSDDWMTFDTQSMLGGSLAGQRKYAEAEQLLLSSYEGLKARADKIPFDEDARLPEALQRIVHFYEAKDQPEKITEWKKTLAEACVATGRRDESLKLREEALRLSRKVNGREHPDTLSAMNHLAASYHQAGRRDAALQLREEVLTLRRKVLGPDHPETLRTMNELADSYLQLGRVTEATSLLAEASTRTPVDTHLAMKGAAFQVWFAMDADYAATRQRMLKWAATDAKRPDDAERVAKLACLLPIDDAAVREATLALARRAVELGQGNKGFLPWAYLALGMAEYRSGHYPAADEALTTAANTSAAGGGGFVEVTASFYRAMSLFKQGRQAEARELCTAAEAKMKPLPADEQNPLPAGNTNADDLILWLACKEAKALLNAPPSK